METLLATSANFSLSNSKATKSRLFFTLPEDVADTTATLPAVRAALAPFLLPGTSLRFSRKAGCSCGCSPGFVVEGAQFKGMPNGNLPRKVVAADALNDVHVTLELAAEVLR